MIKALLIAPIRFYRFFLSPWIGRQCRFTPTCSAYAIEAIERHGAVRGLWLAARRIGRCIPGRQAGWIPFRTRLKKTGAAAAQAATPVPDTIAVKLAGFAVPLSLPQAPWIFDELSSG